MGRPTISPRGQLLDGEEAKEKAEKLRAAMKGFGTSEEEIIEVLVSLNSDQRQQVMETYAGFGRDLIDDLKSELGGDFEDACVALMTPTDALDAKFLREAIQGPGTCENTLAGILCTRDNDELNAIEAKYKELYDVELKDDLESDVSGDFGSLCLALVNGGRLDDDDEDLAEEEAKKLQEAGIGSLGTDEEHFNFILCNSSDKQLRNIMRKYKDITGQNLYEDIGNEFSGVLKDGYQAMLKCAYNKPRYFAERLHNAMSGIGTDEGEVIRILVTRAEIDLEDIKDYYVQISGTPLVEEICKEFGGDLEKVLKSVVEGHYCA